MKAGFTQIPTDLLLGKTSQALKSKRGQMPRSEAANANQTTVIECWIDELATIARDGRCFVSG